MTTRLIACAFCKHFRREIRSETICSAFPTGIPKAIAYGKNHHTEPWPGDNGIRFEPRPGFEDALQVWKPNHKTGVLEPWIAPPKLRRPIPWARPKR